MMGMSGKGKTFWASFVFELTLVIERKPGESARKLREIVHKARESERKPKETERTRGK